MVNSESLQRWNVTVYLTPLTVVCTQHRRAPPPVGNNNGLRNVNDSSRERTLGISFPKGSVVVLSFCVLCVVDISGRTRVSDPVDSHW